MNLINVLFGISFIGKVDDVPVVAGDQHRTICAVYNSLVSGLFSVQCIRIPGLVQNGGT